LCDKKSALKVINLFEIFSKKIVRQTPIFGLKKVKNHFSFRFW